MLSQALPPRPGVEVRRRRGGQRRRRDRGSGRRGSARMWSASRSDRGRASRCAPPTRRSRSRLSLRRCLSASPKAHVLGEFLVPVPEAVPLKEAGVGLRVARVDNQPRALDGAQCSARRRHTSFGPGGRPHILVDVANRAFGRGRSGALPVMIPAPGEVKCTNEHPVAMGRRIARDQPGPGRRVAGPPRADVALAVGPQERLRATALIDGQDGRIRIGSSLYQVGGPAWRLDGGKIVSLTA